MKKSMTYYRCKGCGTVAGPYQVEPGDDGEPRVDCPCWKGPRWERGVWTACPSAADDDLRVALLHQAGERLASSLRANGCLRFGGQVGECEARGMDDRQMCGPCLVLPEWVSAVDQAYPGPTVAPSSELAKIALKAAATEATRAAVDATHADLEGGPFPCEVTDCEEWATVVIVGESGDFHFCDMHATPSSASDVGEETLYQDTCDHPCELCDEFDYRTEKSRLTPWVCAPCHNRTLDAARASATTERPGVCALMEDGVPHGPHKVSDQHFCGGVPTEVWADLANDLGDFIIATPVPLGEQAFAWKRERDKLLNRLDGLMSDARCDCWKRENQVCDVCQGSAVADTHTAQEGDN